MTYTFFAFLDQQYVYLPSVKKSAFYQTVFIKMYNFDQYFWREITDNKTVDFLFSSTILAHFV